MALFRTIPKTREQMTDWTQLDDRVWQHPGCIVDLGCARWDWSGCFLGKKRVVGADPLGEAVAGADFFPGIVGPANGTAHLAVSGWEGEGSTVVMNSVNNHAYPMLTWANFCKMFGIDQIAALKINIEGSEFGLINGMSEPQFAKIDQIALAFHPTLPPGMDKAVAATTAYLQALGYKHQVISARAKWSLFVREG